MPSCVSLFEEDDTILTMSSGRHSDREWTETHARLLVEGDGTLDRLKDHQHESIASSHAHILKIPVEEVEAKSNGSSYRPDALARIAGHKSCNYRQTNPLRRPLSKHSLPQGDLRTSRIHQAGPSRRILHAFLGI